VAIAPGETLVLYTDGVIDRRGPAGRFGGRRLRRLLLEHAADTPAGMLAALEAELDRFAPAGQADDTAAVALRALPVRIPSEEQRVAEGVS
jgi:serine phosphatase RsbU (regulator of sigma subunit)